MKTKLANTVLVLVMIIGFNTKNGKWTELDIFQPEAIKLAAGLYSYGITSYYWNGSQWINTVTEKPPSQWSKKYISPMVDWMNKPYTEKEKKDIDDSLLMIGGGP